LLDEKPSAAEHVIDVFIAEFRATALLTIPSRSHPEPRKRMRKTSLRRTPITIYFRFK
jgi:hypothetical protein